MGPQLTLVGTRRTEQHENLDRVSSRISASIVRFCRQRIGVTFHADDLRSHVCREVPGTSPGSPDRVLRDLRMRGVVHYSVVSRAKSLYLMIGVTQ